MVVFHLKHCVNKHSEWLGLQHQPRLKILRNQIQLCQTDNKQSISFSCCYYLYNNMLLYSIYKGVSSGQGWSKVLHGISHQCQGQCQTTLIKRREREKNIQIHSNWSGSAPKFNEVFLCPCSMPLSSLVEISCVFLLTNKQTTKQTQAKTWPPRSR